MKLMVFVFNKFAVFLITQYYPQIEQQLKTPELIALESEDDANLLRTQIPQRTGLRHVVGHRGSVVACATYKREITGLIPCWAELCSDVVPLGKALWPNMHSFDPGVKVDT